MVPAKNRPAWSQAPSFIRQPSGSPTVTNGATAPLSGSRVRKPSRAASTRPPDERTTTAPTAWPTSQPRNAPPPSSRSTRPTSMSTQYREPLAASQQGPSPSEAPGTGSGDGVPVIPSPHRIVLRTSEYHSRSVRPPRRQPAAQV